MSQHEAPPDPALAALLHDAVADVHPEQGPGEVRSRARRDAGASTRRWLPVTLAAAAATVVVIGGTTWAGDRDASPDPPGARGGGDTARDATTGPARPSAPARPSGPAGRTVEVTAYVVGDTALGPRLFPDRRTVGDATDSDLEVALQETVGAPSADPDHASAWPVRGTSVSAEVGADAITVDLRGADPGTEVAPASAQRAVQALVWTADTATRSRLPVRLTIGGEEVDRLWGVDVSSPVAPADGDDVLSPVVVDTPGEGGIVGSAFTVTGRASAPEATVVWQLRDGAEVVREGRATASECCTLAPYTFEVSAPLGSFTLVVSDTDSRGSGGSGGSAGSGGAGVTRDSKAISVK